jgi:membrane protease YdiL (CAAX protease family)
MNPYDETPPQPAGDSSTPHEPERHEPNPAPVVVADFPSPPADDLTYRIPVKTYPSDLQITWSWPHLIVFVVFGITSLILVDGLMVAFFAPHRHLSQEELQAYFMSNAKFAIGSMLTWYALLFFFLYVTLSLLRGHSFWESLGWRKIQPRVGELPRNPFIYFAAGSGLSLFVAIASSRMKTPENMPIEEVFKYRNTALMFMAMAVLVAPLVEETLFRGYLYPLFARTFGVGVGILLTGALFGLMHGYQLGWSWELVGMLAFVGVVFTTVRARTGSVFASYLMHLGYNSLISCFAILGTHGFTKMPSH